MMTRPMSACNTSKWRALLMVCAMFCTFFSLSSKVSAQTSWEWQTTSYDRYWKSITYGNGLYVALANDGAANRIATSPDGVNWTTRKTPAEFFTWNSIAYGNGIFVAVGNSCMMTSTDGITWTSRIPPVRDWSSITYANGLFVAVATNGTGTRVMTSTNGTTWTLRTAAADNFWTSVTYGNGLFIAVSTDGTNRVMTSPDGINWTLRDSAADSGWYSVTYGNGLFVAVAISGVNRVMTSPDGITWTTQNAAANNQWMSVTYGNGLFIAVSTDGTNRLMTSPDGTTWTARSLTVTNNWTTITYANGKFIAMAAYGVSGKYIMSSANGISWTYTNYINLDSYWNSITYGNGTFVAVGGGQNRVMTSTNGTTWTLRTAAANNTWKSVTYGNGLFVAVSTDGTNRVMTSPDGANWTARSAAANNQWMSVTYGNGLFVAIASSYSGVQSIMTSPDGINWTIRNASTFGISWNSVGYGNGLFVALAYKSLMTSPDGINWTTQYSAALSSSEGTWCSTAYGNNNFVAVSSYDVTASNPPATSPDGINWTLRNGASVGDIYSVTYGNNYFVATYGDGAIFSTDGGVTWTRRAVAGNMWSSVAYGNGLFVAVANNAKGNSIMTSGSLCTSPVISVQPQPQTVCKGTNTSLSVTATGSNLSYQWKKGGVNVGDNSAILSFNNAQTSSAGTYNVVITNECGTATSNSVTLSIDSAVPPTITAPNTILPVIGGSIMLTASAGYSSYLWSNGATTQSISVSSEGSYTVRGTGLTGCQSAASPATVVTQANCGSPYVFNACSSSFSISCNRLGSTVFYMGWQTSAAISSYRIFWRPTGTSAWYSTATYDGSKSGFKLENLIPNTNYDIKFLVGCTGTGTAVYTNTNQFRTLNLLCSVTTFSPTTVGKNAAELTFAAEPAIAQYELSWKAANESIWHGKVVNNIPAVGKAQITGLVANTSYTFRVRAICNNGYQDMTRFRYGTFTTTTEPLCSVPVFSVTPATGNDLLVSWDNSSYKYVRVYWKVTSASSSKSDTTSASSYLLTGLVAGEVYEIKMQGVCNALSEATGTSAVQTFMPLPNLSCATPAIDSNRTFANRTATIYWTSNSNIAGYEVQRKINGTWYAAQTALGTANRYTFTSAMLPVNYGNSFEVRIRAKCADSGLWAAYSYDTLVFAPSVARLGEQQPTTVEVYPNPSTGIVNVVLDNAEVAEYALSNTLGQAVMSGQLQGDAQINTLEMSHLSAGVYVLQVRTATQLVTKEIRLVK